jgi:hypothetical protein
LTKKSKIIVLVITFIAGGIAGVLLFPSKTVIRRSEKDIQTIEDLKLRLKQKENIVIVEKPSGEKITKIVRVTEREEAKDTKTNTKTKNYEKIEINKKSFVIGVGVFHDGKVYGRMSYDILPFLSLGANASLGKIGLDIGLRF